MIPVVDLFAGPGGLGEGFSALTDTRGRHLFRIRLSIEMNEFAHQSLRLRSFFRQFKNSDVPEEYYDTLRGKLSIQELYERFPDQADASGDEAWQTELGKVNPVEVDKRIAAKIGSSRNWILIGGPPCQAYSLAGRSRVKPVDPEKYENDHRHFLYLEYLRILATHQPPVFVMENVKGILSSTVKGTKIVDQIIRDLQEPFRSLAPRLQSASGLSYKLYPLAAYDTENLFADRERSPSDYVIRSEMHGIPQARHRFILLGVRGDLEWTPGKLRVFPEQISTWDAIGDLPPLRSRLSKEQDSSREWRTAVAELVCKISRLNGAVDPEVARRVITTVPQLSNAASGGQFVEWSKRPAWRERWFYDSRLGGVCNHEARGHIKEDLWRYMYAACFAALHERSPRLYDFPSILWPDHQNVTANGARRGNLPFDDRFRVQLKNKFSSTVTSHISKDGHYFIHPDARQCRSLTVREAARLQTFPDNYFFVGPRTMQYQQVGNAVPPLLASKIARIVADLYSD
ncbi:MAG TPA: DNA cytosine methyltransferase [Candidatus Angelobacter sp.]|nr:DNA cytosine methyltransferase [Candidatus Angelobacter sp.]